MGFFDSIYQGLKFLIDPVFNPILQLPPGVAIFIISVIIALITTFAYKWTTDQKKMKQLKDEQKELQKKMKESRDNPKKMMEYNKEAMQKSLVMMNESFKPMLITLVPILLIFMWLNLHLSYLPILPGQEFNVTVNFKDNSLGPIALTADGLAIVGGNATRDIVNNQATWTINGPEGNYKLSFLYDNRVYEMPVMITTAKEYTTPLLKVSESNIQQISIGQEKLKIDLGLFKLSWFWVYLIFTLILSSVLRKVLNVY